MYCSSCYFKQGTLSLSHTGHTAYTVVHSCKPYIQPNQPQPSPNSLGSFECICESRSRFLKLKNRYGSHVRVRSYKRSYKTVRERVRPYEAGYIHQSMKSNPCQYRIQIVWNRTRPFPSPTSNTRSAHTVSYDHRTTNTFKVRIIHGPVR